MPQIVFEDDAKAEFLAAVDWYRQFNEDAAERLVDEVERAVSLVAEAPERWRIRGRARQYLVHGFPYAVVYTYSAERDLVIILAVAHAKRRPGYWRDR